MASRGSEKRERARPVAKTRDTLGAGLQDHISIFYTFHHGKFSSAVKDGVVIVILRSSRDPAHGRRGSRSIHTVIRIAHPHHEDPDRPDRSELYCTSARKDRVCA